MLIALSATVALPVVYVLILILDANRITPSVLEKAQILDVASIRIHDLPSGWKEIILKVEDPGFYEHNGVDLSTAGAGLTTITQGLVKLPWSARYPRWPQPRWGAHFSSGHISLRGFESQPRQPRAHD